MVRNILREPDVLKAMGFGHAKLWEDIKGGKFPSPVRLGPKAVGWFADEIAAYQKQLPRVNDRGLERGAA